ncbi:MAG: riboflavin synthase [Flavobacteriales bacterium]
MFTGIIEALGTVKRVEEHGTNKDFFVQADFVAELKIDQSVSHNGVCLTVVEINDAEYRVTAIDETLRLTNLNDWREGTRVNLERCMVANGRFDGHIVQGHVDTTAKVVSIENVDGSWNFGFQLAQAHSGLIVHKGSICINGVSLTVTSVEEKSFSVSIIPYTFEHTNFSQFKIGDRVNIEFDVLGKYVQAQLSRA